MKGPGILSVAMRQYLLRSAIWTAAPKTKNLFCSKMRIGHTSELSEIIE